jgi:DNA-binding transcriptional ArsR family regulator
MTIEQSRGDRNAGSAGSDGDGNENGAVAGVAPVALSIPAALSTPAADLEHSVKVFKALSDPVRLQILRYLKRVGRGVTCGEVGREISMSKSTGSYHFKTLREAGLINTRRESREKYVSLNREAFDTYVTGFLKAL